MINFLFFIGVTSGLFFILDDVLKLPPLSTTKNIKLATKKEQSIKDKALNFMVMPIVKMVAPFFVIASYKDKMMEKKLKRAGIPLTPKEYMARSVVVGVLTTIASYFLIVIALNGMKWISLVLGVLVYFNLNNEVSDKLKEKDRLIEQTV